MSDQAEDSGSVPKGPAADSEPAAGPRAAGRRAGPATGSGAGPVRKPKVAEKPVAKTPVAAMAPLAPEDVSETLSTPPLPLLPSLPQLFNLPVPSVSAQLPGIPSDLVGTAGFEAMDRAVQAAAGQLSAGISPLSVALALFDWGAHLAAAPGKRMEIAKRAGQRALRWQAHLLASTAHADTPPVIAPQPGDRRFDHEGWESPPFSLLAQSFLLTQKFWETATRGVPGVMRHHEEVVSFAARQMLDMMAPSNNPFLNPEVIERTRASGGANFLRGWQNWGDDTLRRLTHRPPAGTEAFRPGQEVAVTPGEVIFRNHLIELIQYAPATEAVRAEPVLIVPAWIMKYYVLDLSPHNSLIRHLVSEGHTVFVISWRNPDAGDRDLSLDDYRSKGVMAALDVVGKVLPGRKVHGVGYCLGGTLFSIAAAAMAARGDDRLATLSLLAAQTDFSEAGELQLFIDPGQMQMLDGMMWSKGYLSADQMAGAFQLLRSSDLVWSRIVRDYMLGERAPMNDLMAWNADSTRMPYRMHAEYLQRLYLDNDLAAGRFVVDGHPALLQDIRIPVFAVGTERDHVAPWRSVYKIHALVEAEVTFTLVSGGHNAGIVTGAENPRARHRIATRRPEEMLKTAEEWQEAHAPRPGSWWGPWSDWLVRRGSGDPVAPPAMGAPSAGLVPLDPAPGTYIHVR